MNPLRRVATLSFVTVMISISAFPLHTERAWSIPNTYATARSVLVEATVQANPPKITLYWDHAQASSNIVVSRKSKNDTFFPLPLATLPGSATRYEDSDVQVGVGYEYKVWTNPSQEGYVYAGIQIPMVEDRGIVHLVVDNTKSASLELELTRLEMDLRGDGWEVLRDDVSPYDSVENVKSLILGHYNANPNRLKAVFLFGRIPVPYSGNFAPDGHSNHIGAWPADSYYADMDGDWTDFAVNNTSASGYRNDNVPGDGKFDQSNIASDPELMVGRVDLSSMSYFALDHTELLRQYLDKDHRFRHGEIEAPVRALVDDNFTSRTEGFAQSGWRLASLTGIDGVAAGDWSSLASESYLWAYGCGPGNYGGASGIASTSGYAATTYRAVFQMLFGSYFGDWDHGNDFLRAPLCNPDYGLACCWAGRPNWQFHHMGLGEPIGYAALLSWTYSPYIMGARVQGAHVALMGDPTLRMHPIPPPQDVEVVVGSGLAHLAWTPSSDQIEGYHIYRSDSVEGPFQRITSTPIADAFFSDDTPPEGESVYMVRALKLQSSASGTYYNLSQGAYSTLVEQVGELPLAVEGWNLYE
ncbi:MAG: hypothetical protein H6751_01460 [Candidatus Omnitrophica bacterium]|nr:hypothetical protein [Candidatus Omnitrophota bacterium]